MKMLMIAAAMVISSGAYAWDGDCHTGHTDGQCNDAKYFKCYVFDGDRVSYHSNSNGWTEQYLVQYRAMKLCRAESRVPRTCQAQGCQTYRP